MVHEVKMRRHRIMAKVVKLPHHINGNPHHHPVHFKSWTQLPEMEAYHDPEEPEVVLVPVMRAIQELSQVPGMGYVYWSQQDADAGSRRSHHGVLEAIEGYDGFFRIPISCCEVTDPSSSLAA